MPVQLPAVAWPTELVEAGPSEDPTILLAAAVKIGSASHPVQAVRVISDIFAIDYRAELGEDGYGDYQLEEMLDELTFFDDIDKSVLVPLAGAY